jgi:hypothetical protein
MNREALDISDGSAWHGWRTRDVTASRIACLFDAHPFLTREGLAAQLRGGARRRPDDQHMRAGRILEPGVAVAISEAHSSWKLTKTTAYYRLPDERIGASPDYFLDSDGLVQIGAVSADEWKRLHARPPVYKRLQTLCELLVTGRTRGVLAIMVRQVPELPLHLFDLELTPAAERAILEASRLWWQAFGAGAIADAAPIGGLADQVDVVASSSRPTTRAVVRTWTDGLGRRIQGERPAA